MNDRLLSLLREAIAGHMAALEAGRVTVDEWQSAMASDLLVFHTAAYMDARGVRDVSPQAQQQLNGVVGTQVDYLNAFADEIDDANGDPAMFPRWAARADMYADALTHSASIGKTWGWPLPVHPGDGGTPCRSRCRCSWDIQVEDAEELNGNAYWRLGGDSCAGCRARAAQYSPLRIVGGEIA